MSDDRLAFATIRELGRMLRSGETTPTALAAFFMERLETVGRRLNAVVAVTRERALREAWLAEQELAAGYDRGPLHGIPYGAKDLLAAAGSPTTWGAAPLQHQVFAEDAAATARLRDAGAVLVAKLAMVELAGGMGYGQPNASFTGPGINPWNTEAWSGGSSSGSAAAVAAGAVPFAIGSETLGSILGPASACGVTGLRPTYGRVSRRGAMALSWTLDKLGPLAHTADDCGLVLAVTAGADPGDPSTLSTAFAYAPERERTSGFRLGVLRDGLEGMQVAVRENFEAALTVLAEVAQLEEVQLPEYPYAETTRVILSVEAAAALEDLLDSGRVAELTAPAGRTGGYAGMLIPAVDYLRALRLRRRIVAELDTLLRHVDGIVAPSRAEVASRLDQPRLGRALARAIGSASNLAGLPMVTVPTGFGERGLPTGLQIVGRAGAEHAILAVACSYQERTDWHMQHPVTEE